MASRPLRRRIGMITHDLDAFFITEVVRGARRRLEENGAALHLVFPYLADLSTDTMLDQLTRAPADGWIVAGFQESEACDAALRRLDLPHVWVNHFPKDAAYTVSSDDRLGMTRLMDSLLTDGGFRRFLYVDNRQFTIVPLPGKLRKEAFEESLRAFPDATAVHHHREPQDPWCTRLAERLAKDLKAPGPYPVIVCYNDYTAVDLLPALARLGLVARRDFGITGYSDWPMTQHTIPSLTTVRQFPERMGSEAAQMILKRVEGRPIPPAERQVLTDVLVVTRDSVRMPLRGASPGPEPGRSA